MKNLSLKTLALGILALFAVTTVSAQEEPAKKKNILRDDEVDRAGMEVQRCMELTVTNRSKA